MPKIYGLLIAKDEDDVIGQSINHALSFCDKVIVMDNMSQDATWAIVQAMAEANPGRVIPYAQLGGPFHDGMRAAGYNAFRHELSSEDWWLRLDADEFVHDDPIVVVEQANREKADFIRANMMNFELTELDLVEIEAQRDSRDTPIELRRHYYRVNWREYRLFRNDPGAAWDAEANPQFPQALTLRRLASKEVFIRHYGNRDIEQLVKRTARRFGSPAFAHVPHSDWRQYLKSSKTLHYFTPGRPVKFNPYMDFWPRRIMIEVRKRARAHNAPAVLQRLLAHG